MPVHIITKACGQLPRAVVVKAVRQRQLSPIACRIAEDVLVRGFRQAVAARHAGVSRQRVHSICKAVLATISADSAQRGTTR